MKFPHTTHRSWSDSTWYILTFLSFVTLVSIAGYLLIQQQKQFLLNDRKNELATIADLKTAQLVQWRKERIAEGASIRANAMMAHRIKEYIAGKDVISIRSELKAWIANLVDLGEYNKGVLMTPVGTVIATNAGLINTPSQHYRELAAEAALDQELILSDFHRDSAGKPLEINLAIPIVQREGAGNRCIAVLVLDIEPAKRLYPLIQSWPNNSSSAETLLVKREGDSVLFLNNLRHRKKSETPFLRPITDLTMPAVMAIFGREGTFTGIDYRGKEVLSAIRIVPGTQWGMVAKIDISEVMAPLSKSVWWIVAFGLVIIITMVLGVFLWGVRRRTVMLGKEIEIEQRHNLQLKKSEESLEQQISVRTSDLSDINILLRKEIDEREQLEQQLLVAKRLEAIGQIAGGVAHEVRNPLNAILTITEALFKEKEIENNPEFEPYIHHIRNQVNRLVHLMNDLLDLGRTIPTTNLQQLPLFELCRETLEFWQANGMASNKSAVLCTNNDDVSPQIFADPLKLQQIFFNLLENAGHHTPAGGKILLQLLDSPSTGVEDMAAVQVIDQGSGIPEEMLVHVFEPFYTDRKGGTGLGLALVKHFAENMGGSVQLWNNSPPPGCTVEVRIPLYKKEQ